MPKNTLNIEPDGYYQISISKEDAELLNSLLEMFLNTFEDHRVATIATHLHDVTYSIVNRDTSEDEKLLARHKLEKVGGDEATADSTEKGT